MYRTHTCGELRPEHAGQETLLAGWVHRRRDHGGLIFLDLRDSSGIVQVVVNPKDAPAAHEVASEVRGEYVVKVRGTVTPLRTVFLDAVEGGRVDKVFVENGAIVEAAALEEAALDPADEILHRPLGQGRQLRVMRTKRSESFG